MKVTGKLREWGVQPAGNAFSAPEIGIRLVGLLVAPGNPRDGKRITTSRVASVRGRRITTESGSVYVLSGPPSSAYSAWCKEQGIKLNLRSPIKIKKLVEGSRDGVVASKELF